MTDSSSTPRTDALLRDWAALDGDIAYCTAPPTWEMYCAMRDHALELESTLAGALPIAVDDRQPSDLETALVWTNLGWRFAVYHAGGTWTLYGMGKESAYSEQFMVTHWMRLPAPPKVT